MINDILALLESQKFFFEMLEQNTYADGYLDEEEVVLIDGFYNYVSTNVISFPEITGSAIANIDNFILLIENWQNPNQD